MSEQTLYPYEPDYISPPGDTLLELLDERGMTQTELAERTGRPIKTINGIIKGHKAITAETALQLERVLSVPARFWLAREQEYREFLARQAESEALRPYLSWVDNFPVAAMQRLGWLPSAPTPQQRLVDLLQYFGLAHPDSWADVWADCLVSYRQAKAYASDDYALSAWLRQGEIAAQALRCAPYDAKRFAALLHGELRQLTTSRSLPEIAARLPALCAEAGVAVALVPQVAGARVSGATRWLSKEKALIQLSLRYKRDDQLWFTFFHEAGHILLHGKRDVFIDLEQPGSPSQKEAEADRFAADLLIPPEAYVAFLEGRNGRCFSKEAVQQFATRVGLAPGIVDGRLQHDGHLPPTHLNGLKQKLDWSTLR